MNPLSIIVGAVGGFLGKREDRKKARETGLSKIEQAKVDGQNDLALEDAEWEAVAVEKQDSSWKDEYVTIIVTLPWVSGFIGALLYAFGHTGVLEGTEKFVEFMVSNNVDVGWLMTMVIGAAVGLKLWRGR